jgi:uncharacterized protein YkwD
MEKIKAGFLILLCVFSVGISSSVSANSFGNLFNDERKIFELINKERQKKSLNSLSWDSKLADLARSYSQKMARESFFDHYDRNGNSLADRAKAMRITGWRLLGENLFMCDDVDEEYSNIAVKGWMKSSGHRQNILERKFNQTGIGVARSRDGMIYVTQVFVQR